MMPLRDPQAPLCELRIADELRSELTKILAAVRVESEHAFQFADLGRVDAAAVAAHSGAQAAGPHPPGAHATTGATGTAGALGTSGAVGTPAGAGGVALLAQLLYHYAYARPFTESAAGTADGAPANGADPHARFSPDASFVAALQAAHESRQRWDPRWHVFQADPSGAVHVEKGDVRRLLSPGAFAFAAAAGRPPAAGDWVDALVLHESVETQPGYFFAFGETVPSDHDDAQLARFYFNSPSAAAPWLLSTVSRELNSMRVPYRMKCPSHPALYERADAAVLYVAKRFVPAALRALAPFRAELDERMREGTPLFTKPLGPGLGAGDEPGSGQSFGQARTLLVAQALFDAWRAGRSAAEDKLLAVHARFEASGLSLDRPHLNEGCADLYQWTPTGCRT